LFQQGGFANLTASQAIQSDGPAIVSEDVADGDPCWKTNQDFPYGYCVARNECPYSFFLIDYLYSITIE
jgi:hypothetical protein